MSPAGRLWSAASIGVALFLAHPAAAAEANPPSGKAAEANPANGKAADAAPAPGDAALGKALFSGALPMRNGGAACGACHGIGGHGSAFAASFGPDLSHSFEGMPVEAIDGMLQDLPFPTMSPIYTGHALTAQERAHLASFLASGSGAVAPGGGVVAGWAAAIVAALVVLLALGSRRGLRPARAGLVARAPSPERPPMVPRSVHTPESIVAARGARGGSR